MPHAPLVVEAGFLAAVTGLGWKMAQRNETLWAAPVGMLAACIAQIRRGESPIEDLNQFTGRLAPLSSAVVDIVHELRSTKQSLAALEDELRQKVVQRTYALERTAAVLRTQASRDALTGLLNRGMLDRLVPPMVEKSRAERSALSVVMADLDYFKDLNDTLGHAAGDELLRSIGQLIRCTIRDNDLAFRRGGDEFVLVLPGTDAASAHVIARRLAGLVDALAAPLKLANRPKLSVGISSINDTIVPPAPTEATSPPPADSAATAHDLLHQADIALYAVKGARSRKSAA
jgi:diguanylate cyclase (GGDEF)-like protein